MQGAQLQKQIMVQYLEVHGIRVPVKGSIGSLEGIGFRAYLEVHG